MRRTGAITVQESINHSQLLDLVSQGVQDALQANSLHPTPNHTAPPSLLTNMEATDSDATNTSLPELISANSATSTLTQDNPTVLAMKAQMDMMQKMMVQMQQNMMLVFQPATSPGSTRPRATRPRRNQTLPNGRNPNQQKYCHTHGACNHASPECYSTAEGHKDEATFENRMGGSTRNINL